MFEVCIRIFSDFFRHIFLDIFKRLKTKTTQDDRGLRVNDIVITQVELG